MKHVVIVGKYYPPSFGGIERYTQDVARIASKTSRVTVLVHHKDDASDSIEENANVTVIRCRTNKIIKAQPVSLSMLSYLRCLRPDLLHFNAPNFWAAAMVQLSGYKGPIVITHHADVFGRPLLKHMVKPIYQRLTRRAKCVVVNSFKNADFSTDIPRDVRRIVEIPWAIEAEGYRFSDAERELILNERHRRFGHAPIVGFIGRFVRYKGLSVLIEAMSRINHAHALLIGSGPLRSEMETQVRTAGVADRIHFLGNLDEQEKIRTIGMMDMLVLPSTDTTEAFGLVQVEAQLMELPVVATNLPTGITDVTKDGVTGLLVSPNDPSALAEALLRLINNPDFARRLGAAGRARALSLFTMDVFGSRISALFDRVMRGESIDDLTRRTAQLISETA
jgi:glycosyltransferase involved in cell wall biosynthesis